MTFQTNSSISSAGHIGAEAIAVWRDVLSPAIRTLRQMAGTTEDEFLQIGSDVQGFYQRSSDITMMSNQLVEVVSGDVGHAPAVGR